MDLMPNPSFQATLRGAEVSLLGVREEIFTLGHHKIEPFTVELTLGNGDFWHFDREMLIEGMAAKIGEGKVRVFPFEDDSQLMGIALLGHQDHVIALKKESVRYFLELIERFSPSSASHEEEIDEELRSWMR